jgi:hypothetical protein
LILTVVVCNGLLYYYWKFLKVDFYSCSQDSDCITVKGDCCGCGAGGTATAINKNFEKGWYEKLPKDCICIQVMSNHPSCFKEARCINNKCVLKSKERKWEDETANWKTYRNEEYGFEIKSPANFILKEGEEAAYPSDGYLFPPDEFVFGEPLVRISFPESILYPNTNLIHASLSVYDSWKSKCLIGRISKVKLTEKKIINNHTFYKDVWGEGTPARAYEGISYRTIYKDTCYEINLVTYTASYVTPSVNIKEISEILDQMLSTFKFLE